MSIKKTNIVNKKTDSNFSKFKFSNLLNKGFFSELKDYWAEQEEKMLKKPFKKYWFFILFFLVWYLFFNLVFSFFPLFSFEQFIGTIIVFILGFFGWELFEFGVVEPLVLIFSNGISLQISYLCTGAMEIFILFAAILATFEISLKEKIKGIIIFGVLAFIFNILRIVFTALLIPSNSIEFVEFAHDIFFRILLFIVIALFYIIWVYFSMKNKKM